MRRCESSRSIIDRISAIKQNENKWKERVSRVPDDFSVPRPGSVYEIQGQLQTTQNNWKTRVEQKDVDHFTTEAKLKSVQRRDSSLRHSFHENAINDNNTRNACVNRLIKSDKVDQSPAKFTLLSNFLKNIDDNLSADNQSNEIATMLSSENNQSMFDNNNQQQVYSHKVVIPQMSDHSLSDFFKLSDSSSTCQSRHTTDDFDDIFLQTDLNLNLTKRNVKPHRKTRTTSSKNPLKILNERTDIMDEYDETIYGIAERELRRYKVENIQSKAGFAEEALAALSSKEDFSRVKLKPNDNGNAYELFVSPYKDLMLLSVKGRKKVQLRLVEPSASSINCGDCYLLITSTRVFVWQGICANVIEVNKANELGLWIAKYKDLNYKGFDDKPTMIKSNDPISSVNVIQFWSTLKSDYVQQYNSPGTAEEDEVYEQRIQTTNMVFKVVGNQLIPFDEYWGRPLKYKMLTDSSVLIFDFGAELYLWTGNKADTQSRGHGKALLRQLWANGFDYENCSINPMEPLPECQEQAKPRKGSTRPDWVIVGRLPQLGETTLFKEKFSDWPESSRLIKWDVGVSDSLEKKSSKGDLQPADLDEILKIDHPNVHLTIDGKNVGRGGHWKVMEDGILREFEVITKHVEAWHITDNMAVKLNESSMGQFCSGDAYIIRWDFELKTLGRFKQNQTSGNVSSVFFFWQGADTSVTEKTASALHTIDLDKDRVSQIRVKQHEESPAFCRLFDSSMIVHQGKRKHVQEKSCEMRLFVIRGEIQGENHLIEVQCASESLRTRSSFLLLNTVSGSGYLWFGRLCTDQMKLCARYCVASLNKRKPCELGLPSDVDISIEEIEEGVQHRLFWQDIGAIKRWRCDNTSVTMTPIKGWRVSHVNGALDLIQLKYSLNHDDSGIASFPLVQSTLYKANQPALFIIWNLPHVYLWQGWWPHLTSSGTSDSDSDIDDTALNHDWAMPKNRIAAEKLATLKTLISYLDKHESEGVTSSIIFAGLEPLVFQELFPFWEVNETAKMANIKKGYQMYQQDDCRQTLDKYLTEKFSVTRLQTRPLPECVVLSKIEWYLNDVEFENLFKMSKEEFYEMTAWKQKEKKKEVKLF